MGNEANLKEEGQMENKTEQIVNFYFQEKVSFLVTEIINMYVTTEDTAIKMQCLRLLNEIEG